MVRVMNVVFGIGIAVLLFIVVLLGIRAFYPAPTWEQFNCTYSSYVIPDKAIICPPNMTIQDCSNMQSSLQQNYSADQKRYDDCNKRFQDADKEYGKVVFFVAFIIGIFAVIASMFLLSMTNIAAGTAFAGLALIVYGFMRGWPTTNDALKFVASILAAIIIIVFAVKVNKKYAQRKQDYS